jgi:glycogen operon protein
MTDEDWNSPYARTLGMLLPGDAIEEKDKRGNQIVDETMLVLFNAHYESMQFILPQFHFEGQWELFEGHWDIILDTVAPRGRRELPPLKPGDVFDIESRSMAVFSFHMEEHVEEEE